MSEKGFLEKFGVLRTVTKIKVRFSRASPWSCETHKSFRVSRILAGVQEYLGMTVPVENAYPLIGTFSYRTKKELTVIIEVE